jgi:tetratricopeptide (TPR) repeat protein
MGDKWIGSFPAMRNFSIFFLAASLPLTLTAQTPEEKKEPPKEGATEPAKEPAKRPAGPNQSTQDKATEAFRQLPADYRILMIEAMKRFQSRDFKGAIRFTDRADEIRPPTVWTLNVRGAVAIEQRRFDEGTKYCETALKLEPDFFPAKFNLCEIPFLQHRYPEARQMWEKLLSEYPVNPAFAKDDGTPELLTYRIFLCHLLENNKKSAKEWLEKIPFPSVTPAYHYANAVWERDQGHDNKWQSWLEQAEFVWPELKRANFTDVLIQLGWLKPPFGEEPPPNK